MNDMTLSIKSKTITELELNVFITLNARVQYFANLNLHRNSSISLSLKLGLLSLATHYPPVVVVDAVFVEPTASTKCLGIYLKQKLLWEEHTKIFVQTLHVEFSQCVIS